MPPCRQGGELDIPATSLVTMRPLFVKSQAHSKDGTSCLVSRDSEGEAALLEEMLYSQVHGPFPWSRRAAVVEVVADLGIRDLGVKWFGPVGMWGLRTGCGNQGRPGQGPSCSAVVAPSGPASLV